MKPKARTSHVQKSPEEMQTALDSILSVVATPVPKVKTVEKQATTHAGPTRRRSRFFFRMLDEEIKAMKAASAPTVVDADNAEALKFADALGKTLPPELKLNLEVVRDFFIKEIAPLTLALGAGAVQAQEAIKAVTGSDVEPSTFQKFEKMAHQAVLVRMALFLETYLALPKGSASELMPIPAAVKPPSPVPQQGPTEESSGVRRETKELRRVLQRVLDQGQIQGVGNGPVEG